MKDSLRQKAIELRKKGYSYAYISKITGIGKGTLSYWLTDIQYTPNSETIKAIGLARAKSSITKNSRKKESILEAENQAAKDIATLSKRDLFMLGIGIYVGEGTKSHDQVRVANSDPRVIALMVRWFREIIGLPESHFKARVHLYQDGKDELATNHWSKAIGLPKSSFHKTWIDIRSNKSKKMSGKLPFGTLHLTIRGHGKKEFGSILARKINAWMKYALEERD